MHYLSALLVAILACYPMATNADTLLKPDNFKEISFDDIPKTKFAFVDGGLKMTVAASSSFLLHAYDNIQTVTGFSFKWKKTGEIKVHSSAQEQSKKGDDFYFRLGLIISGDAPFVPFFAPAWIKAIKEYAKHPSDKIIYYVVGSKTEAGKTWESPYTDSITYQSVASQTEGEWQKVDVTLSQPMKIVGLWLMADGDNSKSNFTTEVADLEMKHRK